MKNAFTLHTYLFPTGIGRYSTVLGLLTLLFSIGCGEYPVMTPEEDWNEQQYSPYAETGVVQPALERPSLQLPSEAQPETTPSWNPDLLPSAPTSPSPMTNLQPVNLAQAPVAQTQPELEEAPETAATLSEWAARQRLVESALRIFRDLEVGKRYPVHTQWGTVNLLVRYAFNPRSTISESGSFMCSDFVLYAFTQAGFDLADADLGPRSSGGIEKAFKANRDGEYILYTPQGGAVPPRPGDILFMPGHVAIATAVDGDTLTYTQFNSRTQGTRKITRTASGYRLEATGGRKEISGWGFYYTD